MEAKIEINRFKNKLEKILESKSADEVYDLNILLTPLTRVDSSNS